MSAGIDVVVPVAAGVSPRSECIDALRREVGEAFRIVSAAFAWQARQQALAGSDADVIAFVDSDVVVGDGWLDALRAAWESSPHSIAAVGGPIRADVPGWAAGRLGVLDLGPEARELDPAERTLFGGNLSFWRRAVLGVGGFAAPVDGRDATDWLAEEHEAQRQLGHWGWLVRYEPAMAAARLVDAARPLSRAWQYGRRTGIAGSRERGPALRQAARSAAGAAAALARARRAEALEKAARAAENLAVARTARGVTPLAANGPTPQREASDPVPAQVDLVLLYHRFAAGEPDPLGLCVSPANFETQLRVLRDEFEVVPLAEIAAGLRAGEPGAGRVAITIDDGYIDNLSTGIPLIADAGLPATLFASTGHIESGRRFFWDELQRLITGPGRRPPELQIDGHSWSTATAEQRETARAELHRLTQPGSPWQIESTLQALHAWANAGEQPAATRPVTTAELAEIAATPGIEVGAHTRDHVNLAHQTEAEVRNQVVRSRDDVAAWTGQRPVAFSYPFGIPRHDVHEAARAIVADAGFLYAVVNQPVAVEAGADPYAIPRLFAPDAGADEFRAFVRRALR